APISPALSILVSVTLLYFLNLMRRKTGSTLLSCFALFLVVLTPTGYENYIKVKRSESKIIPEDFVLSQFKSNNKIASVEYHPNEFLKYDIARRQSFYLYKKLDQTKVVPPTANFNEYNGVLVPSPFLPTAL